MAPIWASEVWCATNQSTPSQPNSSLASFQVSSASAMPASNSRLLSVRISLRSPTQRP